MVVLPVVAYAAQMFAHLGSPRLDGDYAVLEAWTRSALDLDALVGRSSLGTCGAQRPCSAQVGLAVSC